jgi:hypothetical protein
VVRGVVACIMRIVPSSFLACGKRKSYPICLCAHMVGPLQGPHMAWVFLGTKQAL